MVLVKVCGLRDPHQALAAARLGADLLGVVLAPSPRRVTGQQARKISEAVMRGYGAPGTAIAGRTDPDGAYTGNSALIRPNFVMENRASSTPRSTLPGSAGVWPALAASSMIVGGEGTDPVSEGPSPVPAPDGDRAGFKPAPTGCPNEGAPSMAPNRPLIVGVFVNQPLEEVQQAYAECHLDLIQLHGDESPEYCHDLARPFIKALRLLPGQGQKELARRMDAYLAVFPEALFLLDTHAPGLYGGTGRPWDWERAARLALRYPILIAGGLTPENVAGVIQAVHPWGVDVSSGVETDGQKDLVKMKAFIEAVRSADRQGESSQATM